MRILHMIGGGDVGGAKTHVLSLVKNLGNHIDVKMISFRPGPFTDDAREMGIDVEVVKTGNFFSDLKKVLRIIRQGNFDVIHSHGAKANMFAVAAKILTKTPTVTTVHSDYRLDYLQNVYKKFSFGLVNTIALRFIDYHIGVSRNFKQMLIKRNFNPENIFTVYNGIEFGNEIKSYSRSEFCKKYNLRISENDVVAGTLVRLDPVKDTGTFIKAAAEVIKQVPTVKFVIGGDGDQRKALERQAAELGVTGNVFFAGWITDSDEFLSSIDINVMTSLSESFPYTLLEGVRLKKATISSDVGGISDLIDSDENGYLFTPRDYKKLAEHIAVLAKDSSKRKEMGQKLFDKACSLFSLDSMCRTQLNIYNTIINWTKDAYLYDVIISGYYGFKNSGDDAILAAIINDLRECRNNIKVMVLSKNPEETKKIYNVNSINRFNLISMLKAMKNCRLFINGGGNLMQDDTSTRSLMYYLGTTWLARKMGAKVMVYANGIGPINKDFNRKLTQKVLNQVNVITLREELSKQELTTLHIDRPKVVVTADPALTVKPIESEKVDRIFQDEGIDVSQQFIGISVRECDNNVRYDESIIARAADYIWEQYGVKPVFIPMQYPRDLDIINSIVSKMRTRPYVISKEYDAAHILGIINRMEMLVGMRLHSLIYAASLGIPVIGLIYDPKVEGFLQYFHQASAGHIKDLSFDKLKSVIDEVWRSRIQIREQLAEVTLKLKEKAFENAKIAVAMIEDKLSTDK